MKYVILKRGALELSVLFSPMIRHADMAKEIEADDGRSKVIAAGFCIIRGREMDQNDEKSLRVECFGVSESMGLVSRPEKDAAIVSRDLHFPAG